MGVAIPAHLVTSDPWQQNVLRWVAAHLSPITEPGATAGAATTPTAETQTTAAPGVALTVPGLTGVLESLGGTILGDAPHADLAEIGADDHHAEHHDLGGADHPDAVPVLQIVLVQPVIDGQVLTWDAVNQVFYNKTP